MIYRTPSEKIKEYYETVGINQSALKVILKQGIEAFVRQQEEILRSDEHYYEEKEHFIIGKGVDCLITEGEVAFKEQFHYNELLRKPPDKPAAIVRMVYDAIPVEQAKVSTFHFYKQEIYNAMNTVKVSTDINPGYYMNRLKPIAEDTRTESLLKDGLCQLYWEDLLEAKGKQVLSKEQHDCIYNVYMSLITHPHTQYLFHPLEYSNEDLDIIYQMPFFWTEEVPVTAAGDDDVDTENTDCKCMPDAIIINHTKHTIAPIDVKTTSGYVTRFETIVDYRRYDIQASYYSRAINMCRDKIGEVIGGKNVTEYSLDNFAFVVESTEFTGTPLVFPLTNGLLNVGTEGNMDEIGGDKEGWTQALGMYVNFKRHNFSVAELVKEINGIIWINEDFKTDLFI